MASGVAQAARPGYLLRMTAYIALLRAVNVGGTGKLAMSDLRAICEGAGLQRPRTYIASGNVVFESARSERAVKEALQAALAARTGNPVGVLLRTGAEMRAVLAANPFADRAPNATVAIFLDQPPPPNALADITGRQLEDVVLGAREIYVHYGQGMARTKLRIPVAKSGTARNMNTIAVLAEWAAKSDAPQA